MRSSCLRCDDDAHMTSLLNELPDAGDDAARLAAGLSYEEYWNAHLARVRTLPRANCDALAKMRQEERV
jgi:hypothetical protein